MIDNPKGNIGKRTKFSQSSMPRTTLEETLVIARALKDDFAAKSASPLDLAQAINRSPSSSDWRYLTGASAAYGLTIGGYNADKIELTELGKKIVMPTEEGEDRISLLNSLISPQILKDFYERYDGNKFPRDDIAKNVLHSMGLPQERLDEALNIVKENGKFVGILLSIKDGLYIRLSTPKSLATTETKDISKQQIAKDTLLNETAPPQPSQNNNVDENKKIDPLKIFISHSKNTKILDQIKTILELGDFKPIIAEEEETTAIPVPKKILDQMRECNAAVINVSVDEEVEGEKTTFTVNQNVLIEIGAAFVLYDEKVILVWDKRVKIPSNLQGLYRCEYEGSELSWLAGTRLQKALLSIKRGNKPTE